MNKDTFHSYLEHPEKLDDASLIQLAELIEEYPYFQAGQLLFVKNLQNQENIRFNKQLKLAAAYATDRKALYRLLNLPTLTNASKPIAREPVAAFQLLETPIKPEPKPKVEPRPPVPEPEPVYEVSPPVPEEEPEPLIELEPPIIPEHEPLVEIEPPIPEPEPLIELEPTPPESEPVVELKPPIPEPEPMIAQGPAADTSPSKYSKTHYLEELERFVPIVDIDLLLFDFPAGGQADLLEFEFENKAPAMQDEDHGSFTEDGQPGYRTTSLDLIQQFLQTDPLQHRPKPRPVRNYISSEPSGSDQKSERDQEIRHEQVVSKSNTKHQDLLDAFIQHEPRIPRPDPVAKAQIQDISLDSLQEDESFMTETLAEIYIRQGYYYKAIMAYEKLSLKYPEKSIYFASQLEKIKELINNQ